MSRGGSLWIALMALVFAIAGAASLGALVLVREQASARAAAAATELNSRRATRSDFACVWGRDLDRDRLEDAAATAAQAVGLRIETLDVQTTKGRDPGRSRLLTMRVEAVGAFDTVIGFLRLGVFEKPSLAIGSLRLTPATGQTVRMQLMATAECAY